MNMWFFWFWFLVFGFFVFSSGPQTCQTNQVFFFFYLILISDVCNGKVGRKTGNKTSEWSEKKVNITHNHQQQPERKKNSGCYEEKKIRNDPGEKKLLILIMKWDDTFSGSTYGCLFVWLSFIQTNSVKWNPQI